MYRFTKKQKEVLKCIKEENPKILICSGAKRAGKTFVIGGPAYLGKIAEHYGEGLSFILGGATYASIQRNVLNDWEELLGTSFTIHKDGHIDVFGNKVYVFGGDNAASWKSVRGFTAQGAFLNEATALHETFVREVISRCSLPNSFVYMDTNPINPLHFVKTSFIDLSGQRLENGQLNIMNFDFCLDDNDALDPEYVESIKKSTPQGVFYDRDVLGLWVNAEGVIFRDYRPDKHIIKEPLQQCIRYFAGVDWGYSHKGSISIVGMDSQHRFYVIEEYTAQYKLIDFWIDKAKEFIKKYGNINFYADSARPEHVYRFQSEGINCTNANKSVLTGIETVSKLLVTDRLYLIQDKVMELPREFGLYVWGENGEPVKENDDALDALRYAIYSDYWMSPECYEFV